MRARCQSDERPFTFADLTDAIMLGAVERVRAKMMTVVAIMACLFAILWSTGTGSEVMQRIVVPMIGDMVSSALLVLFTDKVQMVGSMVGQRPCLNKTFYKTVTCGSLRLRHILTQLNDFDQ